VSAEAAFAALREALVHEPDVEEGRALHAPGLKARGKLFAMLVGGELVVKLPAERCAELVAAGSGRPFESGRRRMREWVSLSAAEADRWRAYADEALAFARR
jgi:hypothetical protein